MRAIGIRAAKGEFSRILKEVRLGKEWVITERGVPIAKLVPIRAEQISLASHLHRLEDAGLLERPSGDAQPLPPPLTLRPKGLAQRWLLEDRDR